MKLYCGIDLHSNNLWLTIIDEQCHRLVEKRMCNDLSQVLKLLEPYRETLVTIAIESTYNWYWLVDGLMDEGYSVKLGNTSAVHQYEGLKHSDDRDDAYHLAHLLQLGICRPAIFIQKQNGQRVICCANAFAWFSNAPPMC